MKVSFFFAWYDFWVGLFYDRAKHTLYICPVPCVVIKIMFNPFIPEQIRSGDIAECKCGYHGHVYGAWIGDKISAPWCPKCERNHLLRYPKERK